MKRFILSLLVFPLILSACSSTDSGKADGEGDGTLSETDLNAKREGRFGSGGIPIAEGEGMFRDIPFDYDSSMLSDIARQDLEANSKVLLENPHLTVTLEGHCDERGTNEYNMALGEQRARAVKTALIGLGVSGSKLTTISYGEELPLDPGHDESAYAQNRRVHLSAGSDGAAAGSKTSRY